MKTKIKESVVTTTTYSYDKYPLVLLTEVKGDSYSTRRIHSGNKPQYDDYLKQLTLMFAKYPKPCDLPFSFDDGDGVNAASKWAKYLATSNNGQYGFLSVPKERYAEFEQDVLAIDFTVFNPEKACLISEKYSLKKKEKKQVELDEIALVEAENE